MNNTNWFRDGAVFKDDHVYALSRSLTMYQDNRGNEISYAIAEYVVTAVGRLYLTAKPANGGKSVKFRPLPNVAPAQGLYLEEAGTKSATPLLLFPSMRLANLYRSTHEKADAKRRAQTRR